MTESELEHGVRLQKEAIEEAKEKGWTPELKEKYVVGVGMENNAMYGDCTIIQHCFIHDGNDDAWKEYAGNTWEEYINEEFETYHPEKPEEEFSLEDF